MSSGSIRAATPEMAAAVVDVVVVHRPERMGEFVGAAEKVTAAREPLVVEVAREALVVEVARG